MDTLIQTAVVLATLVITFIAINLVDYLSIRGGVNASQLSVASLVVLLAVIFPAIAFVIL